MRIPTDEEFDKLVSRALDDLPKKYTEKLDNVAIVIADEPTLEQRQKLRLHNGQTLFGLYEGVPQTRRGNPYQIIMPDKITIFKVPMSLISSDQDHLYRRVRHTLWHEIAHYFGLGHEQIHRLDGTI